MTTTARRHEYTHQLTLRRPMVIRLSCGHLLRLVFRGQGKMYVERCECTQIEEE